MTLDDYVQQLNSFVHNGWGYQSHGIQQTLADQGTETAVNNFAGLAAHAYADNGVVFACMLVRQLAFSSVRFRWQQLLNGSPSDTFGNSELAILERPWQGGTTQDMLSRMIQDADLAGNSYWVREGRGAVSDRVPGESLVRLRPDCVQIVGEKRYMNTARRAASRGGGQVGWRKLGYLYTEGGIGSGNEPVAFTVDEVAHFAPIPDPLAEFVGMSWLTPILREIQADQVMTKHQRKFFENGATPNMIIKHNPMADRAAIIKWAQELEANHAGVDNAWKNLNLYPGADATVVGANLKDIDFGDVRAGGEVRVAAAAGVPPVIVGLSKGLDSSTYSNYSQARRRFADGTMHPLWQNAAGSLERIMAVPGDGTRLWYDATDVPFLREDEKDAAEIASVKAQTINSYITAGYEPDSVVKAVMANDPRLLVHSGYYSVQLQELGADQKPEIQMRAGRFPVPVRAERLAPMEQLGAADGEDNATR